MTPKRRAPLRKPSAAMAVRSDGGSMFGAEEGGGMLDVDWEAWSTVDANVATEVTTFGAGQKGKLGVLGWCGSEERDVQVQGWQHRRASAEKHIDRRSTASLFPTILTVFRSHCYSDVDTHSCTPLCSHVVGPEETLLLMSRSSGGVTTCVYERSCYDS